MIAGEIISLITRDLLEFFQPSWQQEKYESH